MKTISPISATEVINTLNRRNNHDAATCLECVYGKNVFYTNHRYEQKLAGGTIKYIPIALNRAVIVWPKAWRKSVDPLELYPRFSVYNRDRAALEFFDHTIIDEWPVTVSKKQERALRKGRK